MVILIRLECKHCNRVSDIDLRQFVLTLKDSTDRGFVAIPATVFCAQCLREIPVLQIQEEEVVPGSEIMDITKG